MGEGLVGGGACLREEMWENGRRGLVVVVVVVAWALGFGTVVEALGWERREAADFEVRVEGPLDWRGFLGPGSLAVGFVVAGVDVAALRSG